MNFVSTSLKPLIPSYIKIKSNHCPIKSLLSLPTNTNSNCPSKQTQLEPIIILPKTHIFRKLTKEEDDQQENINLTKPLFNHIPSRLDHNKLDILTRRVQQSKTSSKFIGFTGNSKPIQADSNLLSPIRKQKPTKSSSNIRDFCPVKYDIDNIPEPRTPTRVSSDSFSKLGVSKSSKKWIWRGKKGILDKEIIDNWHKYIDESKKV